jgi:transcriptional regulator with XRE-family HTH domain
MRPRNRLARLARAVSGETQKDFAGKTGVHHTLLAQYENGQIEPGPENLERLARGAGLTVADCEEILRLADTLRRARQRAGQGDAELFQELLAAQVSSIHQRLLRLPLAETGPGPTRTAR